MVLPELISEDHSGFIKNRCISDNIRTLDSAIKYAENKGLPGLLLFLYFEKAFETLEWSFINQTIWHFGFGPSLLNWVELFYCNTVEILAEAIRNKKEVKDIKIQNTEVKVSQYADDTTLILDGTEESVRASLLLIKAFGDISGLRLNNKKTEALWIGSRRNSVPKKL